MQAGKQGKGKKNKNGYCTAIAQGAFQSFWERLTRCFSKWEQDVSLLDVPEIH
jgi:hypothetical protein